MLQSMVEEEVPTRAEVSDVANAILDKSDAVMTSAETSMGKHPALVIKTMANIIKTTEEHLQDLTSKNELARYSDRILETSHNERLREALSVGAMNCARLAGVEAIIVGSHSV